MIKVVGIIIGIILLSFLVFFVLGGNDDMEINFDHNLKYVALNDDGLFFNIRTSADTVSEFLGEQKINVKDEDQIFPEKEAKIFSGTKINLCRAKKLTITIGKDNQEILALGRTAESALAENNIELGEDDILSPSLYSPISDKGKIEIIRVEIKEEKIIKDIDFKKISEEDDELSWRTTKIKQKGIKGKKEVAYRVVSHNNKEISRKVLSEEVIQEPTPEIKVQGTYVKLGKSHSGAASWYSFTGEMTAANPWLPMGSYVKVTNRSNGKTIIVKIVDRGPFGPGRIIDLEKVAFAKIADLGAGVVDVKMEEILN